MRNGRGMTTLRTTLTITLPLGLVAAVTGVLAAPTLTWSAGEAARSTSPVFDPTHFTHPVSNPYFPLTPGLVTRLRGSDGDEKFVEKVRVTHRTKMIAGVNTTVVRDVVRRPDGTLAETTDDWYANDDEGNVWYLGEDTATYDEHGNLEDREGSWEAGVQGAEPGIIMLANPRPPMATRMEFSKGVAEDQAWVVQRLGRITTPGGRFTDVVRTLEWGRLEPRVISQKFYAAGLGIVEERDLAAGDEHFWVVSSHQP
jgi:hypothetical protein